MTGASAVLLPTHVWEGAELPNVYKEFWRAFRRMVSLSSPRELELGVEEGVPGQTIRFIIKEPIVLWAVQSKGVKLDVYLTGTHTVGRINSTGGPVWTLVEAESNILYLEAREKSEIQAEWRANVPSRAYGGYRFKVERRGSAKHTPDCRAAYDLETIEETRITRCYVEKDAAWKARAAHGLPQLPTAPLDFAGLLYVVLHSHCGNLVASGWPKSMTDVLSRLPAFQVESDARSHSANWYDHSHRPVQRKPMPLPRFWPTGFEVPEPHKTEGWKVQISNRETTEDPHLTIIHGRDRDWRISLVDGTMLHGSGPKTEIPEKVMAAIEAMSVAWCDLWDEKYPAMKIKDRKWCAG